jgi:hypothetical protein
MGAQPPSRIRRRVKTMAMFTEKRSKSCPAILPSRGYQAFSKERKLT